MSLDGTTLSSMTLEGAQAAGVLRDTAWPHVHLDERGVAWIDQTRVKVVEVVLDHVAWGWSPELIHDNHPHLSRAQIYAALAYYFDHQVEIDRAIDADVAFVDEARARAPQPPLSRGALRRRLASR